MAPVRRADRRKGQHRGGHRNRPSGPPHQTLQRIVGSGDVRFSEQLGDYGGQVCCGSSIFELRDGKIARETDYFGESFEPPA